MTVETSLLKSRTEIPVDLMPKISYAKKKNAKWLDQMSLSQAKNSLRSKPNLNWIFVDLKHLIELLTYDLFDDIGNENNLLSYYLINTEIGSLNVP